MTRLCGIDGCDRPVASNAYVCTPCVDACAAGLREVDDLVDQLWYVAAKRARYADGPGPVRSTRSRPLPINTRAGIMVEALRATLACWCGFVAAATGQQPPIRPVEPPPAAPEGTPDTPQAAPGREKPVQRCGVSELPVAYCWHCREKMTP